MTFIAGYTFGDEKISIVWFSDIEGCYISRDFDRHEDITKVVDRILSNQIVIE